MWDQSYRWQRIARTVAGIGTVVAALAGLSFDVPVPPPMLDFSEMGRIRQ